MTSCVCDVCMTCTGERCDVAIDGGFTLYDVTTDVIDKDDSFEPSGNIVFPVILERQNRPKLDKEQEAQLLL